MSPIVAKGLFLHTVLGTKLVVIIDKKDICRWSLVFLDQVCSDYISQVLLFGSQVWTCQYTGQMELTFEDANTSEKKSLKRLESFPSCLVKPVLEVVHHSK